MFPLGTPFSNLFLFWSHSFRWTDPNELLIYGYVYQLRMRVRHMPVTLQRLLFYAQHPRAIQENSNQA